MEAVLAALVGAGATIIVALIGIYGAVRFKIGSNQDRLVETLNYLIKAQEQKISILDAQVKEYEANVAALTRKVAELERTVVSQAETIAALTGANGQK